MDNEERRSHARDMYLTRVTSRIGAAKVKKQEEEADTIVIVRW